MANPWFLIGMRTAWLMWEAQTVVAMRMMKLAAGGAAAQAEADGMIAEKAVAMTAAQMAAGLSFAHGGDGAAAARKVLGVYGRKVRANRRRLLR